MLQVECESCQAPYQIDERRIPPAGLKMRCPKCGHSFVVGSPGAPSVAAPAPPAAPAPKPPPKSPLPSDFPAVFGTLDEPDLPVVSADLPAAKKLPPRPAPKGVPRPNPPTLSPGLPVPKAPPAPTFKATTRTAATRLAPDSADFGDIDLDLDVEPDLPEVPSDLPARAKTTAPRGAPPPPRTAPRITLAGDPRAVAKPPPPLEFDAFEIDLPAPVADLPEARGGIVGLPSLAGDLPAIAAGLPVVASSLPVLADALPMAAAGLPVVAARGFGEIDLPTPVESLPTVASPDRHLPAKRGDSVAPSASFGEIDLPREAVVAPSPLPPADSNPAVSTARDPSGDFRELELDDRPRARGHASGRHGVVSEPSRVDGGMSFGEVELGQSEGASSEAQGSIGVEVPAPAAPGSLPPELPAARAEAAATSRSKRDETPAGRGERRSGGARKKSLGRILAIGGVVAAVLGGAALQLTPGGAYGYLYVEDLLSAGAYERATSATVGKTEQVLAVDTYDAANAAVEVAQASHTRTPRAKSLAAYAALVDCAVGVRFGPDPARASRAKQLLAELPPNDPIPYREVALAAQSAQADDWQKASTAIEAVGRRLVGDPVEVEVALLRGEVALALQDGASALAAFQRAQQLANDARAHYGLARAYQLAGDSGKAAREIEATLAASPDHPGALTARARMSSSPADEPQALKDLTVVLEGSARSKASPNELSRAYAARAWLCAARGSASEARDSFAQAVKLDPRNVPALRGEGRLLLSEGRYTEALARFDTALQLDPRSPDTIADDAEAKLALERLADAKLQLTDARQAFPKSVPVVLLLGRVEEHLGNLSAAETDLRTAMAMADPARSEAVLPYVALSELLSSRGRLTDAKATLDQAKQRLTPSAALDRALGDVAELQGEHDAAIALYQAAIAKDARDVAAHFRLAVALRRIRKFDEASTELDKVAAVDRDYPGLSLERGLLYEESGDVEKAIVEFRGALSRAPSDPDLQLRVGSAYVAIGRPDDAIPMLRKVLESRPTSAEAHHYLGRALMQKGPTQQVDALRYLKRAVDLDPNRAEFHVYLAWAANEAVPAQLELARDEIDKALALDKLAAEAYWQKGVLERMEGAIEDSIKDEKRALELRPSRYEAHATLAECYQDRNDDGTAMGEWAKAVAGDSDANAPDGIVRHPYWRYKYGKLLLDHGSVAPALSMLLPAAITVEKTDAHQAWVAPLEFSTAVSLRKVGRKADALEHFHRFLDAAPVSSPDRAEAESALKQLGSR